MRKKNRSLQIRMCIVCKKRISQKELCRYEVCDCDIRYWNGIGRSFYICKDCLDKDINLIKKSLGKYVKNMHQISQNDLKERLVNGECQD